MNLIQQFPDISGSIRAKIKRANIPVNATRPLPYSEDIALAAHYEGKFRRWHLKLLFIIASCVGTIYFALLNSAWIINSLALKW
jgi:hypothetical protein